MTNRIFSGVPTPREVLALIGLAHREEEVTESAANVRSRLIYQIVRPETVVRPEAAIRHEQVLPPDRVADLPSLAPAVRPQLHSATPWTTTAQPAVRTRPWIQGAVRWSRLTMGAVRFLVVHALRLARPVLVAAALAAVALSRVTYRMTMTGLRSRRLRRPVLAGAALAAIVVIVAGGIWNLRARNAFPIANVLAVMSPPTQTQQDAVVPPAMPTKPEPVRASPAQHQTRSLPAVAPPKTSRAISPSPAGRHARPIAEPASGTVDATAQAGLATVAEPPEGAPPPRAAELSHTATVGRLPVAPLRVYGADDPDVVPPTPVNSRKQGLTPAQAKDIGTIEVVIDERGNVASARAVVPPRTIGESIEQAASLQAIKSWQFRPALKDGTPVRYLQQLVP